MPLFDKLFGYLAGVGTAVSIYTNTPEAMADQADKTREATRLNFEDTKVNPGDLVGCTGSKNQKADTILLFNEKLKLDLLGLTEMRSETPSRIAEIKKLVAIQKAAAIMFHVNIDGVENELKRLLGVTANQINSSEVNKLAAEVNEMYDAVILLEKFNKGKRNDLINETRYDGFSTTITNNAFQRLEDNGLKCPTELIARVALGGVLSSDKPSSQPILTDTASDPKTDKKSGQEAQASGLNLLSDIKSKLIYVTDHWVQALANFNGLVNDEMKSAGYKAYLPYYFPARPLKQVNELPTFRGAENDGEQTEDVKPEGPTLRDRGTENDGVVGVQKKIKPTPAEVASVKTELGELISNMKQVVQDANGRRVEAFLTEDQLQGISNGLITMAMDLNVDILDFLKEFKANVSHRTIYFYPDINKKDRAGEVQSDETNGRIRIWEVTGENMKATLTHEFLHGMMAPYYRFKKSKTYREGLTELLTILADSADGQMGYETYKESTLLVVAIGIWYHIINNARTSDGPISFKQLMNVPRIAELTQLKSINIDSTDFNVIFNKPVADTKHSKKTSTNKLKSEIESAGGDWNDFIGSQIEEVASVIDNKERQALVGNRLKELWSY